MFRTKSSQPAVDQVAVEAAVIREAEYAAQRADYAERRRASRAAAQRRFDTDGLPRHIYLER